MATTFSTWLQNAMNDYGFSQKQLSTASHISTSQVSKLINGEREPGIVSFQGLALAFDIPVETIMRIANKLPPEPKTKEEAEELYRMIMNLPKKDLKKISELISVLYAPEKPPTALPITESR